MGSEKKWIYLSYIAVTLLVSWVLNKFLVLGFASMRWANPNVMGVLPRTQVMSAVVCVVAGFLYFRQEKVDIFSMEVLQELKKVTWPAQRSLRSQRLSWWFWCSSYR